MNKNENNITNTLIYPIHSSLNEMYTMVNSEIILHLIAEFDGENSDYAIYYEVIPVLDCNTLHWVYTKYERVLSSKRAKSGAEFTTVFKELIGSIDIAENGVYVIDCGGVEISIEYLSSEIVRLKYIEHKGPAITEVLFYDANSIHNWHYDTIDGDIVYDIDSLSGYLLDNDMYKYAKDFKTNKRYGIKCKSITYFDECKEYLFNARVSNYLGAQIKITRTTSSSKLEIRLLPLYRYNNVIYGENTIGIMPVLGKDNSYYSLSFNAPSFGEAMAMAIDIIRSPIVRYEQDGHTHTFTFTWKDLARVCNEEYVLYYTVFEGKDKANIDWVKHREPFLTDHICSAEVDLAALRRNMLGYDTTTTIGKYTSANYINMEYEAVATSDFSGYTGILEDRMIGGMF